MESNESAKVTCPKCGSENINYQAVPVLSRKKGKGFFWWLLIGWWWWIIELIFWIFATLPMLIANLIIREDKITRVDFYAVCQNCGNGWKVKHKTNKKANLIRFFITMGFILLFLLIVIPSNQDGGGQRSEDPNTIYTQAAETMFAGMTQTAAVNPDAIYTQVAATLYAQASKPTEMPIAEPTQTLLPEIGTRSNPVPFGQPLDLIYQDIANFQITILEVVRGQDAWNMIYEANMFNEQPVEGTEYVLAKVGITYQTSTQQDYTLSIDSFYFDSVSNNQILDSPLIVEPEPDLNVKLFPGGYGEGYITILTYVGDPAPLIVFEDWISFDSTPFYFATTP